MIDLHCHMLPGIDDGAPDLETSLAMARMAVEDGIEVTACTPHIMPGVYDNNGTDIKQRIDDLQGHLDAEGIALKLVCGADTHIAPDMTHGLKDGRIPSLADSRYMLFEPPHHVPPPRLEYAVFDVMAAGYHPIITHPERLSWIESHYDTMTKLAQAGAWMQITCGSVTGNFGKRPQYWAERMLDEGLVHILATDAHNLRNRRPVMSKARELVAERLSEQAATDMVLTRPAGVLDNVPPDKLPERVGAPRPEQAPGLFARLFSRGGEARKRSQ
ncbi:MAG TPA: CpsB/CapC family capsule biosynthesis tyrosine phosphatase [Caulobacteraceae bacterium]